MHRALDKCLYVEEKFRGIGRIFFIPKIVYL